MTPERQKKKDEPISIQSITGTVSGDSIIVAGKDAVHNVWIGAGGDIVASGKTIPPDAHVISQDQAFERIRAILQADPNFR